MHFHTPYPHACNNLAHNKLTGETSRWAVARERRVGGSRDAIEGETGERDSRAHGVYGTG